MKGTVMKHISMLLIAGAMLLGAATFTGCKKEEPSMEKAAEKIGDKMKEVGKEADKAAEAVKEKAEEVAK